MEKVIDFIKKEKIIFLIFFVALALRLIFLSPWLEDWDSVQFAMALHNFSIVDHQPHPPGYPLYILIGKLFYFVLRDDTKALTTLSAFFGSLIIIPFYYLVKNMFNKTTAILAAILFLSTPIEWTLSEVALTNIPGLFMLLIVAYLLYTWVNNSKLLVFACIFAGLALGFRFTEFPVIAGFLILVFIKQKNLKYMVFCFTAFLLGITLWILPLALITGFKEFIDSYSWIANYVIHHDALLGKSNSFIDLLITRLKDLWYLLKVSYTPYFFGLGIFSTLWLAVTKKNWFQFRYQFLGIWFLSYLIPLVFIYNLEVPRYTLPLLGPIAISTALLLSSGIKRNSVFSIALVFLLIVIFRQGLSQVQRFQNNIPPTIEPVEYVNKNFNPADTIIATSFTYRQFQYYAPKFKVFYGDRIDKESILEKKTIVIDYIGLKDKITQYKDYKIIQTKNFTGERDIFTRIPEVTLYILKAV